MKFIGDIKKAYKELTGDKITYAPYYLTENTRGLYKCVRGYVYPTSFHHTGGEYRYGYKFYRNNDK